jgi:hypothetical protein
MNATFAASSGIEGLDGGGTLKHPVFFGEAVTEHAIFTVWSMRKIGNLIEQIFQAPELKSQSLEDKDSASGIPITRFGHSGAVQLGLLAFCYPA